MTTLWTELDRTFSELDRRLRMSPAARRTTRHASARPGIHVSEAEDSWTLAVDLPGVPPDDVSVELEDDVLRIRASRTITPHADARAVRRERRAWTIDEGLRIPASIDSEGITATLRDGRLTVSLPRRTSRSRSVAIQTR